VKPDERRTDRDYKPTPAELAGIDRGLRDAAPGHFATQPQVDAALAKLRGA
jgi:predicted transcriptional regulator